MNTNAKVKLGIFYLNLDIGPLVDINEIFISCQNFKYFVPNQMVSLNFFSCLCSSLSNNELSANADAMNS